jgi:hypothetical protein
MTTPDVPLTNLSDSERVHLDKMIRVNEAEDHTDKIRELKHSKKIFDDVNELIRIKKEWGRKAFEVAHEKDFDMECETKCNFLFVKYTDIYNKVKKDEMNMDILLQLINVLHYIEDGAVDQHEGSVMVGKLLKQIYIDGAVMKGEKLDAQSKGNDEDDSVEVRKAKPISWAEYKNQRAAIEHDLDEVLGVD